jgi:hypothetical protein
VEGKKRTDPLLAEANARVTVSTGKIMRFSSTSHAFFHNTAEYCRIGRTFDHSNTSNIFRSSREYLKDFDYILLGSLVLLFKRIKTVNCAACANIFIIADKIAAAFLLRGGYSDSLNS